MAGSGPVQILCHCAYRWNSARSIGSRRGDRESGQVVARLVDEDSSLAVQRAHDKVIEQEAILNVEKAELQAALTEWENPIERQRAVDIGEAQVAETKATLQQIASEIAMDQSQTSSTPSQHDRAVGLHSSGAISEQEFVRLSFATRRTGFKNSFPSEQTCRNQRACSQT